jgi:hypothetical protein
MVNGQNTGSLNSPLTIHHLRKKMIRIVADKRSVATKVQPEHKADIKNLFLFI